MKKKYGIRVMAAGILTAAILAGCSEGDTLGDIAKEAVSLPGDVGSMSKEEIEDKAKNALDQAGLSEGGVIVDAAGAAVDNAKDAFGAEVGDLAHYVAVTAMDKLNLEAACSNIKKAYLDEDWVAISDKIRYPLNMADGTVLNGPEEFIDYMADKTIAAEDKAQMEAESCHDMFYNGSGICFGSGQVWMNDASYMTDEEPKLEIISLSGIVPKE